METLNFIYIHLRKPCSYLFPQAESVYDLTISIDTFLFKIVEEPSPFADHLNEPLP